MKYFSFLLIITLFLNPVQANALPTSFGGQIVGAFPCTCNVVPSWILYIRDVRYQFPLPIIYQPGLTFLYKLYQPRPAVNAIGTFAPAGVCMIYVVSGCAPLPIIGTMLQLGTSAAIMVK